jgi:hypothetical protein
MIVEALLGFVCGPGSSVGMPGVHLLLIVVGAAAVVLQHVAVVLRAVGARPTSTVFYPATSSPRHDSQWSLASCSECVLVRVTGR